MDIGLLSLGDVLPDPATGELPSDARRTRSIVERAVEAEALGFDLVAIGEHHGSAYQTSAPPVILAAIGERTRRVRLSTGVTLAANLDPVRMAEDYATLDVLTGGRAEIVAGRGTLFARTFDYLGQDARQSRKLFAEHVELLVRLLAEERVDHPAGGLRPPLDGFTMRPRPTGTVPVWVGGGSTVDSPLLAARLGLPLMLPSVFGPPKSFVPIVEAYRAAWEEAGHPGRGRVGAIAHCHIAPTTQQARAAFRPHYEQYWTFIQTLIEEYSPHLPPVVFDFDELLAGPAVCGSPAEALERIAGDRELLDLDRFTFLFDIGGTPEPLLCETLQRFGTEVLPHLRD